MKLFRLATAAASWAPAGIAEAVLAAYMLGAWFDPYLFGERTPYDVRFLVFAEFGFLTLGNFAIMAIQRRQHWADRIGAAGVGVAWLILIVVFVFRAAGPLAVGVFVVHVFSTVWWVWNRGAADRERFAKHVMGPWVFLMAVGSLVSLLPFPALGWTYDGIPEAVIMVMNDRTTPNWFPATGFLYFFALALWHGGVGRHTRGDTGPDAD